MAYQCVVSEITDFVNSMIELFYKMSRSFRKNSIIGITTCESEKQAKKIANRRFRRITNIRIQIRKFDFPLIREISNIWNFGKDGKQYLKKIDEKEMRK